MRNRRIQSRLLTLLGTLSLLAAGCGDDKDWDQEIILQLFKPVSPKDIGKVKIEATQSGQTRGVTVGNSIFGSCDTNTVRIIPRDASPVVIKVTPTTGVAVSKTVKLPASNPVQLLLSSSLAVEPRACAPAIKPDGGPLPDGPSYPTGFMCNKGAQCAGGLCITSYMSSGTTYTLPKGYCSRDCMKDPCPSYELCYENKNGLGQVQSKVCLKTCSSNSQCRTADKYHCTAGNVCLPE